MSLETPISVRTLQRKPYRKAKQESNFRFYLLYDKIYREDILNHAYELVKANKGAPGVDGQTFEQIELQGRSEWLEGIRKDLHDKTYRPQPVRRVLIPKPGGGEGPLGIPTIRDRTVQTAAKLVLEPIFESDSLCSLTRFESLLALGFRRSVSLLACVDGICDVLFPSAGQILDLSTNFLTCGCDLFQSAPEFASE
jgi:hypothetical protein